MSDNYMKDPRAHTFEAWVEMNLIFQKHNSEADNPDPITAAEHDVIYIGIGEEVAEDSEDGVILLGLGFHWDESVDCWARFT